MAGIIYVKAERCAVKDCPSLSQCFRPGQAKLGGISVPLSPFNDARGASTFSGGQHLFQYQPAFSTDSFPTTYAEIFSGRRLTISC